MYSSPSAVTPSSSPKSAWIPPTATTEDENDPGELNRTVSNLSLDEPICFRICGIPLGWDKGDLEESLRDTYPNLNLQSAQLSALFPACCEPSQTALLTIHRRLERDILPGQDKEKYHFFPIRANDRDKGSRLRFDKHFHDLTPMNIPERPIGADLIAITGLSGHAFGSWRSRVGTVGRPLDRPMWLRDFLPERFPHTRIMIYGYDSSLSKPTGYNLLDYARGFEQCIMNARRDCPERPIIFIAHSLGGLLVNQLLLKWAQRQKHEPIFNSVRGIFFFGTPHAGLRTQELSEMVNKGIWDKKTQILLTQLAEGCEYLESQKDCLSRMWDRYKGQIFTFYETEKTNVVKEVVPGVWDRSGGLFQMVQRSSAQLFMPNERRFPVQSNHTDMVKFNSPDDKAFQDVVTCLESCDVQYNRAAVIESLVQEVLPGQTKFYVDPLKHLHGRDDEPSSVKNTASFFFLLHNLDYKNWILETGQVQTLVYKSFPCLPYALPHLLGTLRSIGENCLRLHFSPSRIGQTELIKTSKDNKHMTSVVVWTFFCQAVETFSRDQRQSLLQGFLHILLTSLRDDELIDIQKFPGSRFDTIIQCSNCDSLWAALEEVLIKAANLFPRANRKSSLKIILNLARAKDEWEEIIHKIRLVVQSLRREFSHVKLLITDPPDTINIPLLQPSEVIVSYDQERQECLETLYFKNLRYDKISIHHSHTLAWLWESPEYTSWISLRHPDSGLLFIEGKPGSGKSTLVRYFADNFTPPSEAIVLKFFYNTRDGESERDHRNMLRALLYQLLKADEAFFVHFQSIYRRGGGKVIEWCSDDMKNILRSCKTHPQPRTIYLIIDAMDESACTDRADIIQFLHQLSAPVRDNTGCMVNVFLASRPINELQFSNWPGRREILLQEKNQGDIERYTHNLLQNEDFSSVNLEVKKEIEEYILRFSDGVFIWVCLVLKELAEEAMNGSRKSTLMSFLDSLPKSLESLYECMLQRLADNKEQARTDGKRILQFCLFSERAMALVDLEHALAIPGLPKDKEPDSKFWTSEKPVDIRKMLTHCVGGFVDVKASTKVFPAVQVMHQTVRDFFLRPRDFVRRSHLNVTEHGALEMIQLTCIRFLEVVSEEVIGLRIHGTGGVSNAQIRRHLEYLEKRPFIRFSLEYLKANSNVLAERIKERLETLLERVESSPRSLMMVLLNAILPSDTKFRVDVKFGVDVQIHTDRLILHAAMMGYPTAIRNLLATSATTKVQNKRQETPLHLAARGGHCAATMFLLDSGAYLEAKDIENRTALHHAVLEKHEDVVQVLLTNNAELDARDNRNQNALHLAALNGLEAIVRVLLSNKADIQARDSDGCNALHLAAINGHKSVVQLLLNNNAELWATDQLGRNALHLAALNGHEAVVQHFLIENHELLKASDSHGCSPLHLAALNGLESMLLLLLSYNVALQALDKRGRNALHLAALKGHQRIVQHLLATDVDIHAVDQEGYNALHLAAISGHESVIHLLLTEHADLHIAKDKYGRNSLHLAVLNEQEAVVQLLLTHNMDLDARDSKNQTALHLAVLDNREAIVQLLLNHDADPDARDSKNQTALHLAVLDNREAIVQLLLDHDPDQDAQDFDDETALHSAVRGNREAIVQLLLTHHADPDVQNEHGQTALHLAVLDNREAIVQLLLTYNANLDTQNASGQAALHFAAKYGQEAIAQFLLNRNVDTQVHDKDGQTALHLAIIHQQETVVQLLLTYNANPDAQNASGQTALHTAVQYYQKAIVQLLLDQNADTQAQDARGQTALHLAVENRQNDIVQLLSGRSAATQAQDANSPNLAALNTPNCNKWLPTLLLR